MERLGFIHDKLDIKILVLYCMSRAAAPLDLPALTELIFCDDGINYFDFAESLSDLVSTGHLELDGGFYSITEKGRENGAICESSLAYSVRARVDKALLLLNAKLRRNMQVRTGFRPRAGGGYTVSLSLDDEYDTVLSMELLAPDREQAEQMEHRFRADAERVYNELLVSLLET